MHAVPAKMDLNDVPIKEPELSFEPHPIMEPLIPPGHPPEYTPLPTASSTTDSMGSPISTSSPILSHFSLPQDHIKMSAFAVIIGFVPCGLIALFCSYQVHRYNRHGNYAKAIIASKCTVMWGIVSFAVNLFFGYKCYNCFYHHY
jgi:hypothetical protein